MPDVFAMLKDDHREVERLFGQFRTSKDPDVARQINDELTVHAIVEEELVYGLLASKVSNGMAMEARQEHDQAKQIIQQIEAGLSAGNDVTGLVEELEAAVKHHVQEEENEMFPKLEEDIPSLIEAMGDELAPRREEVKAEVREARSLGEQPGVVANRPPGH